MVAVLRPGKYAEYYVLINTLNTERMQGKCWSFVGGL